MIDNYNQNPNQLQPNVINPNAMGNMQTLQGINGTQIPNTFNRTIGTTIMDPNAPVAAPQNVQTQIMPDNNLQTY